MSLLSPTAAFLFMRLDESGYDRAISRARELHAATWAKVSNQLIPEAPRRGAHLRA